MSELNREERAAMRELAAKATPGPWEIAASPEVASLDELISWFRSLVEKDPNLWVWGVIASPPRDEDNPVVALTGNGPLGETHSRFIAAARSFVPKALDALAAAEASLAAYREALKDMAHTTCNYCLVGLSFRCQGYPNGPSQGEAEGLCALPRVLLADRDKAAAKEATS